MSDSLLNDLILLGAGGVVGIGASYLGQWWEARRQDRKEHNAQVEELFLLAHKWGTLADDHADMLSRPLGYSPERNKSLEQELAQVRERITVLVGVHLPQVADNVESLRNALRELTVVSRAFDPTEKSPEASRHLRDASREVAERVGDLQSAAVALLRRSSGMGWLLAPWRLLTRILNG